MSTYLVNSLGTTDALSRVFSDESMLQAMLDFEVALAKAGARVGVIPERAADAIRVSARAEHFDAVRIAREARESGTIAIPLVQALTAHVRVVDADSARFVHWGATSQDVADSALVLALKRARPVLAADHQRLDASLRHLSDRHAGTVMVGRTLLQPAPPITFGLKAAGWVAALGRGWARMDREYRGGDGRAIGWRVGHTLRVRRSRHRCRERGRGGVGADGSGGTVAHGPRSTCRAPVVRGDLHGDAWKDRSRHCAPDAGRGWRSGRTWRRVLDAAAQAESGGVRRGHRGGDADAGARRGVPERHASGTRTRRWRLAC